MNSDIDALAGAAYKLSAADARLRGRATRSPDALSLTHARALRSLADDGPLTVTALAARVETSKAAVTQLVNGLVAAGLVSREPSEIGDRRVVTVALTAAGHARHRARQRHLEQSLDTIVAGLDTEQIHLVASVLVQLAGLYDSL